MYRDLTDIAPRIETIVSPLEIGGVLANAATQLGEVFSVSRCVILPNNQNLDSVRRPVEWTAFAPDEALDQYSVALARAIQNKMRGGDEPCIAIDAENISAVNGTQAALDALDVRSILAHDVCYRGRSLATVLLYQCGEARSWSPAELSLVRELSHFIGIGMHHAMMLDRVRTTGSFEELRAREPRELKIQGERREPQSLYERLIEHCDAIVFHADRDHAIRFISRRSLDFFGVPPEDFIGRESVCWIDLIHPDDRERIRAHLTRPGAQAGAFTEEFRIVNHITGRERMLLAQVVPIENDRGVVTGWDGFAVDATLRHEAQKALEEQSKKVRALYTVSSAIRGYVDPINISARGIISLCDATNADAALCFLYADSFPRRLELVAHHGFSIGFVERLANASTVPNLAQCVAEHGQSVVVADVENDPRSTHVLAEEGVRSALLVPIEAEDEVLGTLGLFSRTLSRFNGGDVLLVSAAANQIGLAARQANLFSAYRKQANNLSALYKISHDLAQNLNIDEVFQRAFSILRDELGLKRLWLGLLNETGTRIIGQAAYGPGWKRRLVEINVELTGEGNPIVQVIDKKVPLMLDNPEGVFAEFGLRKIFSRLSISSAALVPIVASGQVLGVLAVEPRGERKTLNDDQLTLLSSLANEIGWAVLAKRLEERIADSDKMRTAGLLAAGIAHNFNNLLQAILGQASLIEMQKADEATRLKASKVIIDAATRGAGLVKQLLSFAHLEDPHVEICDVNAFIEQKAEVLRRMLSDKQELRLNLTQDIPTAHVDPNHLFRILSNIVANASEAIIGFGTIEIFTNYVHVDRNSPHFEVPFGEYIRIGIRDSGIGMDLETKRRCFEPFFTTKNRDPRSGLGMTGAGLGLAAAYALSRKNGGRIVVDSRPGHGSLFTLYLRSAISLQAQQPRNDESEIDFEDDLPAQVSEQ